MHKDANLRKRNALVIPGGLLLFYGLVGLVYAMVLRGDDGTCGDASLIVFAGACRSVLIVLAIPLVLGLGLVAAGALGFRNRATCREGHGSWTHFGFALLLSLVLIPLLGALLAPSLLGPDPSITRNGVEYPVATLMAGLSGVGLLAFVPFVALWYAQSRANPCCREKGCFDPCFCDEALEPATAEAAAEEAPVVPPAPAAWAVAEEPAPVPPAAEAAPAEPPAESWAVVEDEPATAEPSTGPATSATGGEWVTVEQPATADAPAVVAPERAAEPAAPALATRPVDPAAPPADELAQAAQEATEAKWHAEDEEAGHELEATGSEPPTPRRRVRRAPAKKAAGKAAAKPAKKGKK